MIGMQRTSIFQKRFIDMSEGPIAKSLILYAIPVVLSDFLQQLYSSVDSVIVGNIVGKTGLAAVGQTFFITNIFLGCFLGISLGATVAISKYFGAKNKEKLRTAINTTLKLSLILCVLFTILGVVLVPDFLKLVKTTADTYADAKTYLTIYLAGISMQILYNILSGILKAVGDSMRPLRVLAFTCALNVILDLILVGPLHMGVGGAALATIIAQAISCVILWKIINQTELFEKPIITKEKMDKDILKEIFIVGLPYSAQRVITAFSNTIVVSYVNYFGSDTMAGWTIYQKIDQFVISTIISVGSAVTTFVAQNLGANKPQRIRKGVRISLVISLSVSLAYALIFYIFRYPIARIFNTETQVVEVATMLFGCMITVHTINSIPQNLASVLRGMGSSLLATSAMVLCYVVIRQIYLHALWPTHQTVMLVVASYHLTWSICAVLMTILYVIKIRQYLKNHSNN